jgi:thioredoxin reductase (NADPH)
MSILAASSTIKAFSANEKKYDEEYDLAVIGGGSGGLATAFEAARHGLKTIVIDYVEESPAKTKWGLGGTCVNVGCIPKKLMHQASIHGENLVNAKDYGWELPEGLNARENKLQLQKKCFNWKVLISAINNHIKSLNFSYIGNIQDN